MGARLYFPTLGRFAQVDPIPGGNPNDYIYPPDPINMMDLTGAFAIPLFNSCHPICNVASIVAPIAKATGVSAAPYRPTAPAKPSSKPASRPAAAAAGPPKNTSHSIGAGVVSASKSVASRVGGAAFSLWGRGSAVLSGAVKTAAPHALPAALGCAKGVFEAQVTAAAVSWGTGLTISLSPPALAAECALGGAFEVSKRVNPDASAGYDAANWMIWLYNVNRAL